ncbi:chemotaxis protein CheW [Phenylobacterium sp.]|uniref:chemotaxis protein CheW n=1 Tax=Phenylobacterium sp. TaxID=1871053 RepID=UPI00272F34EA|nr:chemotaxis protein CheW [Phenylobacterium sp.]MDP2214449.1 chemotaxis protein CheW [Phenylobacterium sp.]
MAADLIDVLARDDDRIEVITLVVKDVEFCVDIKAVREIRGWTPATPVPHAPAYVKGVINLRGVVMPVLDLAAQLDLGVTEPTSRHVIVVAQCGDKLAGLLVDSVQETFHVSAAQLQSPPAVCERDGVGGVVDAILPLEGRMISRLVVDRLVRHETPLAA